MKNVSTAALVALFYILISFSIDIFSNDMTFSDLSITNILTSFLIFFAAYLAGSLIVHFISELINRKKAN